MLGWHTATATSLYRGSHLQYLTQTPDGFHRVKETSTPSTTQHSLRSFRRASSINPALANTRLGSLMLGLVLGRRRTSTRAFICWKPVGVNSDVVPCARTVAGRLLQSVGRAVQPKLSVRHRLFTHRERPRAV